MTYYPTAEQVGTAWVKTLDGVDATKVATALPGDANVWASTGFVQLAVVGGSPRIHSQMYSPVFQVDCWAANVAGKAPWGRAGSLAAAVVWGCYHGPAPVLVNLGSEFHMGRVHAVIPLSEPRRIEGDEAGFARVQFDMALTWSLVPR